MDKAELEAAMRAVDTLNGELGCDFEELDLLPFAELRTSGECGRIEFCGVDVWCSEDYSLLEEGEDGGLAVLRSNVGKVLNMLQSVIPAKVVAAIRIDNGDASDGQT